MFSSTTPYLYNETTTTLLKYQNLLVLVNVIRHCKMLLWAKCLSSDPFYMKCQVILLILILSNLTFLQVAEVVREKRGCNLCPAHVLLISKSESIVDGLHSGLYHSCMKQKSKSHLSRQLAPFHYTA